MTDTKKPGTGRAARRNLGDCRRSALGYRWPELQKLCPRNDVLLIYVVYQSNGKPLLKRSLVRCSRMTVEKLVAYEMLSIEELFEELGGQI